MRFEDYPLPGRPKYGVPVLPEDITTLSDESLMELFTQIIGWLDFFETELADAKIEQEKQSLVCETIFSAELVKNKDAKSITIAKAMSMASADYVAAVSKKQDIDADTSRLQVIYNSLERMKFLVSRDLSRRGKRYGY